MKRSLLFALGVLYIVCSTIVVHSPAQAQTEEHRLTFGHTSFIPRLAVSQIYDSNIFRRSEDIKGDLITVISPGVGVLHEREDGSFFGASYDADIYRFWENDDLDYINHHAQLEGTYKFLSDFYVNGAGDFKFTADPSGGDNFYEEDQYNVFRWYTTGSLGLGYDSYKFGAELRYTNYYRRYIEDDDSWQNLMRHTAELTLRRRILPKTSLTLGYRWNRFVYPDQNSGDNSVNATSGTSQDSVLHELLAGVKFDATAKITGELRGGVGYKDFLHSRNWNDTKYNDLWTWVLQGDLAYALYEKTSFTLGLEHSLRDSSDESYEAVKFSAAELGVEQRFTDKWTATGAALAEYHDYLPVSSASDRNDFIIGGKVGLQYGVRDWLDVGAAYELRARQSTLGSEDYLSHRVGLTISLEY